MRIRHVVAGMVVGATGLLLTGCDWDRAGTTFEDSARLDQEISEVRFTNDSGNVRITIGDTVEVRRTVKYDDDKPGRTFRVDGGDTLVLEACEARNCWVDYDVTVPDGTRVSGHADSGSVEIAGVASANVETESGDITVRDVPGEVNAAAQSGTVDLSQIGGAVVAGAESGSVSVGLTAARNVAVHTESGDIEVSVPDAKYQVNAVTDSGSVDNGVGDDAAADHTLDLQAESGDITVTQI
jgi:putative adhesin